MIHGGLADRSGEPGPQLSSPPCRAAFAAFNRGGCWSVVGLLHAGDRIIEVNGFSVGGMEPEQVIHVVVRTPPPMKGWGL